MEKLLIKDFNLWYGEQEILYASSRGARLYVKLKAAPNFKRYRVIDKELSTEYQFTSISKAMRKFNSIVTRQERIWGITGSSITFR